MAAQSDPSDHTEPLKFVPLRSVIELGFYTNVLQTKLEHAKLDDSARPMIGLYKPMAVDPALSAKLLINSNALSSQQVPAEHARAEGFIKNVNTIEEFRNIDKSALIQNAARQIWDAIKDGTIYECPSLLALFFVLSYADLKRHKITYWAAYPALHSDPAWRRIGPVERFSPRLSTDLVEKVGTYRYMADERKRGFFLAKLVRAPVDENGRGAPSPAASSGDLDSRPVAPSEDELEWVVGGLGDFEQRGFFDGVPDKRRYVCFVDSSSYEDSPAWPLRNLLVLIRHRFAMTRVKVLCFRDNHAQRHASKSIVLNLELDVPNPEASTSTSTSTPPSPPPMPKVTGWERNSQNKLAFKQVNLKDYMDPKSIADAAIDLNLKLMKWRLAPGLDLDAIKNTRCLLLGAGTLGGYVSRGLMAWGVRKITFVDYGNVSYSNPVRQPLFAFAHCANGGEPKAARAAATLKEIYPGVDTEGHALEVPMLGHPITSRSATYANFEKLRELIADHDALFLLMDTRESRWLPSVMGKAEGKIVLNAALGFDTYVAMRHGAELPDKDATTLGCYFCNDIVAPADSMKDATLDQQCTVTRPGVAAMASATLVEMLASILQHPQRNLAPAPPPGPGPGSAPERDPPSHPLGLVPHQIRGFLSHFQTQLIRGESYPCCSACSPPVLAAYRADGWRFIRRALSEKDYVIELSGLAEVQRRAEEMSKEVDWEEEDDGIADMDVEGELL